MTKNIENVPTSYLLAMFLDYHFQAKRLLDISQDTLTIITDELNCMLPTMEITTDDAKAAWIDWLDEAGHNGTAVSIDFRIAGERSWQHKELEVIDKFIDLSTEAVRNL